MAESEGGQRDIAIQDGRLEDLGNKYAAWLMLLFLSLVIGHFSPGAGRRIKGVGNNVIKKESESTRRTGGTGGELIVEVHRSSAPAVIELSAGKGYPPWQPRWLAFPLWSQDHTLDQSVCDIGRMAQDGRPLVLGHELGLPADQA
jgi:hypothetical protein